MTATEIEPDETLLQLDITACPDGGMLLEQGRCWNCDETTPVRLHRAHLPLLAETAGWLTHAEYHAGIAYNRDRLNLLPAMVRAHCPDGHPLRAAADEIVGRPSKPMAAPGFNAADSEPAEAAPTAPDEQPDLF